MARGIMFRKTGPNLEEIQSRMMVYFPRLGAVFKAQKSTWIFPCGSTLKLRHLQNKDSHEEYQGHQYSWVGFDELGNWKTPDAYDRIKACLRTPLPLGVNRRYLATANPGGVGHEWIKKLFIDPVPQGMRPHPDPRTGLPLLYIPSRLTDNPKLLENNPDYINQLKGTGPDWLVKAWLEGDWNISVQGEIFMREWWQHYDAGRNLPYAPIIIQSWDTAFKKGKTNDRHVCVTAAVIDKKVYILDMTAGRWKFPELKRQAKALVDIWKPTELLVEVKANGQALTDELSDEIGAPIFEINPTEDKLARAYAVTALIEAGRVILPSRARWLDDFLGEVSGFPDLPHDDVVDALTQLLNRVRSRYMTMDGDYSYESVSDYEDDDEW